MKVALFDADVLVYQFAHKSQYTMNQGEEDEYVYTNFEEAIFNLKCYIQEQLDAIGTTKKASVLSSRNNFRKKIFPDYKAQRKKQKKPILFKKLRHYIITHYPTVFMMPYLEADDVMGILATEYPNNYILVSIDKDMQTIPGAYIYNPNRPTDGIMFITEEHALRYHMLQTLMGDSVDNYKGAKGVGIKTATKLVDAALAVTKSEPYQKRLEYLWTQVVSTYELRGHQSPEAEALLNARMAKILTYGFYKLLSDGAIQVRLWSPKDVRQWLYI